VFQFFVIEYLAITDHHNRPVFIINRLITGFQADDGESSEPEADISVNIKSGIVRATMNKAVRHFLDNLGNRLDLFRFDIIVAV